MASTQINPELLGDYEDDESLNDIRQPNRTNVPTATNTVNPPPPPPTMTAQDIKNEFYEKVRWLRDVEPPVENDLEHDDDPEIDNEDVDKAFAEYEKNLPVSTSDDPVQNDEEYEEMIYPEDPEMLEAMVESWNFHVDEYDLANRPSEQLCEDSTSQRTNLNPDAAEFRPSFSSNQHADLTQFTTTQNEEE